VDTVCTRNVFTTLPVYIRFRNLKLPTRYLRLPELLLPYDIGCSAKERQSSIQKTKKDSLTKRRLNVSLFYSLIVRARVLTLVDCKHYSIVDCKRFPFILCSFRNESVRRTVFVLRNVSEKKKAARGSSGSTFQSRTLPSSVSQAHDEARQ